MNRLTLTLLALAVVTVAFAPSIRRALIHYSEYSLPKPDYTAPKYAVGGRYVTKGEFDDHTWLNDKPDPTGFERTP